MTAKEDATHCTIIHRRFYYVPVLYSTCSESPVIGSDSGHGCYKLLSTTTRCSGFPSITMATNNKVAPSDLASCSLYEEPVVGANVLQLCTYITWQSLTPDLSMSDPSVSPASDTLCLSFITDRSSLLRRHGRKHRLLNCPKGGRRSRAT
jgi:hypothetical protein